MEKKMVKHNLMLKLNTPSSEILERVRRHLLSMNGRVPGIKSLVVQADIRPNPTSHHLLMSATFGSIEDFESYLAHPAHLEIGLSVKPYIESAASLLSSD
jgi:hypothetical protein